MGIRAVGWPASELSSVIAARVAGKSEDIIRRIVLELEVSRQRG